MTHVILRIICILLAVVRYSHGFELILNECACGERHDCGGNFSGIWTTLHFETDVEEITQPVIVRLENGQEVCSLEQVSERILVNFSDNALGYNGEMNGLMEDTGEEVDFLISDHGVLTLRPSQEPEQFSKESYCIRRLNKTYAEVEVCCSRQNKSCIRKCCPYGYSFTNNMSDPCSYSMQDGWKLPTLLPGKEGNNMLYKNTSDSRIRTGFPGCQIFPYNFTDVLFNFRMYSDGTVKLLTGDVDSQLKWQSKPETVSYCVDTLASAAKVHMKCNSEEDVPSVLIICREQYIQKNSPNGWTYRMIYITGFCISIVFLLVTAFVHLILWEKQNIHAITILCYVLSLTGFYICLLVIYIDETRKRFSRPYSPFIAEQLCPILGMITHFTGIFSFAWLSVINFDLWWTFRILKPMTQQNIDVKRLLSYAGFAFAVPTAVVSGAIAFHVSYKKQSESCPEPEEDDTIYPRYGEDGCFLGNSSQSYYFYLPVGILLLANLIFYLCTSCQMLKIYNATRRISSERMATKQKQSCELFLKLFLVMGITWIFQVILVCVENDEETWYSAIFTLLDLVNMFQAVAIFIIFVCKKETLRALEQKSSCLKYFLQPFRGFYRTPTTMGRSTDGSYKMSRTELTKHNSIESSSGSDQYRQHLHHKRRDRDSELISFS